jgi:putative transposase
MDIRGFRLTAEPKNRGQSPIKSTWSSLRRFSGMPRQPRFVVPGVTNHVVQRGNNRQACFRRDNDYLLYLLHLRELARKHGCELHAYCLMTNHVHLLLTPSTTQACPSLMRDLGQRYVQYFNRRYARTGTLWEGRYQSFVAESARYVLACYRYIELNPVEARMVAKPADYQWSSYAANTGMRADTLVSPHPEYLALGNAANARHVSYARLVEDGIEQSLVEEIRRAESTGYPLASDAFKAHLAAQLGRKTEPGRPGRPEKQTKTEEAELPEIGL